MFDRRAPVPDFDHLGVGAGFGCAGEDFATDRGGILAARVVVGDDDQVGQFRGDAAHLRALAGIAITTGAEHHGQSAVRAPQRAQHLVQRARLVRVVDQREEILAAVDLLESPGNLGMPQTG